MVETPKGVAASRRKAVFEVAEDAGLFEGATGQVGARISKRLLDAAKLHTGLTSTTEVIQYALAKLAIEDDFGRKLLARKGTVPPDLDLDF